MESLRDFPEACSLAHENDDFPYELRRLLYGSGRRITHRALFRIVDNTVEILAIRHVAQRDVTTEDVP